MGRPLVALAVAFFAGYATARAVTDASAGAGAATAAAAGGVALGAVAAAALRRRGTSVGAALATGAAAAFAGLLVGPHAEVPSWPYAPPGGAPAPLRLRIDGAPDAADETRYSTPGTLAAGSEGGYPAGGRVAIDTDERPPWKPGDTILVRASLAPLREHVNPGAPASRLPGLRAGGFVARLRLADPLAAVRVPADWAQAPPGGGAATAGTASGGVEAAGAWARASASVERVRAAVGKLLDERSGGEARALLRALVLGDQGAIPPGLLEAFSRTGTSHLLSVSGVHVAMLAVVLLAAAGLAGGTAARLGLPARAAAALLAFPGCAAYVAIAGAPVPALRTLAMLAVGLAALVLRRPPDVWSALAGAAVALTLAEPWAPGTPSFDLSFAAVAGCLLLVPPLQRAAAARFPRAAERMKRGPARALGWLAGGLAATAAATLATAPLLAHHIGLLPGAGALANVVVVPLTTVAVVPAALGVAALGVVWPRAGAALLPVPEALADTVVAIVRTAAAAGGALPVARLGAGATALLEGAVLAGGAALQAGVWPRARRALWYAAAVLAGGGAALAGVPAVAARVRTPLLTVTFLDVGQGDAALVELPDGARMLVDTGVDPRGRAVLGALRAAGGRLDRLVLTHGHPDHAGGLAAVLGAPTARGAALWHNDSEASRAYVDAAAVASGLATPLGRSPPPPWRHGGAVVEALWPRAGELPGEDDGLSENDRSVVLRISYGRRAVLLCGDAERETEEALLAGGALLTADVVKVGHHGSRTSSSEAFIAATGAAHAVVSSGWANRFGFPAPEVVAAWTDAGARVWRTARDGAVVLETDGDHLVMHALRE